MSDPQSNTADRDTPKQPFLRRFLTSANSVAAATAVLVFLLLVTAWNTNSGIVASAVAAGVASGAAWLLISRRTAGPNLESSTVDLALLGSIPVDSSGPAPTLTNADAIDRYTGLLREIEGQTTGQILLICSPGPGQGASTVALNLAIAATMAGRRTMLISADSSPNGLGRFLSTGNSPGLSDVAAGTATLSEATRMWELGDGTRFPMLPSGDALSDETDLDGVLVADALDVVSERADLILIDVPPVLWSTATPKLGAHADGTILVVAESADPESVTTAIRNLAEAGAPVLGYVRNRSTSARKLAPTLWRGAVARGVSAALLLLAIFATYTGAQLWYSWNRVETETLDISAVTAPENIESNSEPGEFDVELAAGEDPPAELPQAVAAEEAYETFLIVGGDEVSGAADVILYLVRPTNGADPFMVSIPRDLYVENPCTGGNSRINALIHGCPSKEINGPSLLAFTVGQFTGIEVDHFAQFDFDGFERVIDAVGGVEICVEYAVYDAKAELSLPAGCTIADGSQALAWVRSRKTLQQINGSWKSVPGRGDLQRNQNQQDVIMELIKELKTFDSPSQLTTQVAGLADAFTLDDNLGIADAVNLAWGMRDINLKTIKRLEIPVRLARSTSGQSILLATAAFDEVLIAAYGGSLPSEDVAVQESAAGRE